MRKTDVLTTLMCLLAITQVTLADTIRGIDIDFVTIGHAGNPGDTIVVSDGSTGYGAVNYDYRIGKYEVTNAQWNAFTTAAGAPKGNPSEAYDRDAYYTDILQPTNMLSWYEAIQFCNYLTSGDKSKGVYQFSGNNVNPGDFLGINRDAAKASYGMIYILPTEDEWYKAAYFKPDGNGYSVYANGLNTMPEADNGWNYGGGAYSGPWDVGTGTQEQNGTFDMMGNVREWNETLIGTNRGIRGSSYGHSNLSVMSSFTRDSYGPNNELGNVGFRVVSIVPEPATLLLLGLGGLMIRRKK